MKSKLLISVFCGIFFGIGGYFVFVLFEIKPYLYNAVITGVCYAAMLMIVLMTSEIFYDRKFKKIEKGLNTPVLFKALGNVNLKNDIRACRIWFCEDILVLISLDKKPHMAEGILKGTVTRCELEDITTLSVYTNDLKKYVISSAMAKQILEYMENNNWIG